MVSRINVTKQEQGSSTKLTILMSCIGSMNEIFSNKIQIDSCVVQFRVKQNVYPSLVESMISVRTCSDNVFKVKVFSEENLILERIFCNSDNECWVKVCEEHCSLELRSNDSVYVFLFNVTISVIKLESMINENLYKDTDFTDFRLSTGEGSVHVHRAILATKSDVLRTMLSQEWKETAEGRLQIEGVTLETLQHLKQYMYLGTLPDDGLLPLLSIASCYLMETLKTECISKLTQNVKPEDYCNLLESSMENKLPELTFALINDTPKSIVLAAQKLSAEKNVKKQNVDQNPKEE